MENTFELKKTFSVKPSELYNAWLSSDLHAEMTGAAAKCSAIENEQFSAWDGYISGHNIKLVENKEIVQSWRTSEFKDDDNDSELRIKLSPIEGGTELTLSHSNIPDGQSDYKKGWEEHYFEPMTDFFE